MGKVRWESSGSLANEEARAHPEHPLNREIREI